MQRLWIILFVESLLAQVPWYRVAIGCNTFIFLLELYLDYRQTSRMYRYGVPGQVLVILFILSLHPWAHFIHSFIHSLIHSCTLWFCIGVLSTGCCPCRIYMWIYLWMFGPCIWCPCCGLGLDNTEIANARFWSWISRKRDFSNFFLFHFLV